MVVVVVVEELDGIIAGRTFNNGRLEVDDPNNVDRSGGVTGR